jgi:transposase
LSTKIHVRAEGGGKLMTFVLTPGQQHEATVAEQLLQQGAVKRKSVGRPRLRPHRLVGDKGYSNGRFRRLLRRRGIRLTIPHKSNQPRHGPFDREAYRLRNRVERLMNRLKQYRRVATRYEKRSANYAAMVTIAAIMTWL